MQIVVHMHSQASESQSCTREGASLVWGVSLLRVILHQGLWRWNCSATLQPYFMLIQLPGPF
jgi:hypothetical protein